MRNECSIIRDLLPLYAETMVSEDTAAFVEEHLSRCAACRSECERMRQPQALPELPPEAKDSAPLLQLRKKLAAKRLKTVLLTVVAALALALCAYAALDTPVYLPYSEELLRVEPVGDCGVQITFDESVTDFDYTICPDPDGDFYSCDVQAWYSLWDRWFSGGNGERTVTVFPREPKPVSVMYLPNDGSERVCVYGEAAPGGSVVLARLALGYYFGIAALALALALAVWLAVRKKDAVRAWVERIGLYPASYLASHLLVMGFHWETYSLPRDFRLIVSVSLLLYCALLLSHSLWRLRRELRRTTP